jgi:hypothetical protein
MDRSASERKSKHTTTVVSPDSKGPNTPTRSASVFKMPTIPLIDTATPNGNKKRKAHDKSKTPRGATVAFEGVAPSTPSNGESKKPRAAVAGLNGTPHVASMREATRVLATPTPTNTPLKPSLSFEFEPLNTVPSFLLTDHKPTPNVLESPRHVRASEMIEHAFTNPQGQCRCF